jgi:hypothetical protein
VVLLDLRVFRVKGIDLPLVKSDFVLQVGHLLLWLEVKWSLGTEFLDGKACFRGLVLFFHDVI